MTIGHHLCAIAFAGFALTAVASAQSATTSVWDGVFTDDQTKRGEIAYRQTCANCHGASLEGADMTPPLVGGAFTSNWNDLTLGDLFERIRTTMPLDVPGTLSRQQTVDVIAFILKANAWPAGTHELGTEAAALRQMKIVTQKP